jgi:hypothetical protein
MWIVLDMDENYHMHPIDHMDNNQVHGSDLLDEISSS